MTDTFHDIVARFIDGVDESLAQARAAIPLAFEHISCPDARADAIADALDKLGGVRDEADALARVAERRRMAKPQTDARKAA